MVQGVGGWIFGVCGGDENSFHFMSTESPSVSVCVCLCVWKVEGAVGGEVE